MISRDSHKYTDAQIFASLNPYLKEWFKGKFGSFTEPQKYAIMNIHNAENTLVSAETGTGKTLSAFTAILNELVALSQHNELEDRVYCVYVSPLRALNNDIERNLLEPLKEMEEAAKKKKVKLGVRVGVRTGDTPTSERAKMLRKPPHILITTPETLAIVLNAPKFREMMREVKWVIVDEIHALAGNKRGVHLSLSLERLQKLSSKFTRIGLSATISPLDEVAKFLVGMENEKESRDCKIVDVSFLKKMDLKVISPLPSFVDVSQKQIHDSLYNLLHQLIQKHRTTLVFTNTRAATERVVHNLKEMHPNSYGSNIGAHHSSLSRTHRLNVENRLKKGELKTVVSSTSLELGIDIGYIDLVILLGSPKSIARAIQRIGRSGHQLHEKVKGRIVVLDRDDLVECSVLVKNALEKKLDKVQIPRNALDVLAQQIYGIAIENKIHIEELWNLIRGSYCYSSLSRYDFNEIIDYLSGNYVALEKRSVYSKIWYDPETGIIGKKGKMARIIYMTNIGTIPDEARVKVKMGEIVLGSLDEGFMERLRKGDVFVLGGQSYVFKFARGMTVQVAAAYKRPPTVPSWVSEMLPLSFDLAYEIGKFRGLMDEKLKAGRSREEIMQFINNYLHVEENAANALYEYFNEQYLYSEIPHANKLLVEHYKDEEGKTHIIFHSLYGRRINDALSRAFAFAMGNYLHKDIEMSMNDNGFVLSGYMKMPVEKMIRELKASELRKLTEQAIDQTEMLNRRFRHCAARSLMILRNYKGKQKTAGRQQMNSRLLIAAVRRISNDFSILREARREVLEDLMDIENAEKVLKSIEDGKVKVKHINTKIPTPFAFNLALQGYSDIMKIEDRLEFVKRMHQKVMQQIQGKEKVIAR